MRAGFLRPLRHARSALLGAATLFAAGAGDAAPTGGPAQHARVVEPPRTFVPESVARSTGWAQNLRPIELVNPSTQVSAPITLYGQDGNVDHQANADVERVAASRAVPKGEDPKEPLDPRLVKLVFRAAYHFESTKITVVSATRRGARGQHGHGHAFDFRLEGVPAWKLAQYLRTYPRAGVGIYTHPKTQYVHLDVRDRSYHWLDASPPGVTWREKLLGDPTQQKRDESYVPAMDLPEAATAAP